MTTAQSLASLGSLFATSPLMFRNKLINGNFDIWQRGTSLASIGWLADRWGLDGGGSVTLTQSRQPFALGASNLSAPAKYYYNLNVSSAGNAASGVAILRQRIEGVDTLRGTITVSFWAGCDAGKQISVNVLQIFGTGGSPSATVYAGAQKISPGTSFVKYTLTFNLPSTVGKTLGTNGDDYIEVQFYVTAGTDYAGASGSLGQQTGNFNFAQIQMEQGGVATPFELRPVGVELAMCQRYFEVVYTNGVMVYNQGSVGALMDIVFAVPKRANPTLTYVGGMPTAENTNTPTAVALDRVSTGRVELVWTGSGGPGAATAGRYVNGGTMQFSAEL